MTSVGWKILREEKSYGKHVVALRDGDTLQVTIRPNPIGLMVAEGPLPIPATREVADRVCYTLNSLLEEVCSMHPSKVNHSEPVPEINTDEAIERSRSDRCLRPSDLFFNEEPLPARVD